MRRMVSLSEISDGKLYGLNDMVKADCGNCKGCSDCCHGMGDSVVIDPHDMFRLSTGLKLRFEELLADKLALGVVDGIVLPHLNMSGTDEACPFLSKEGRCTIHEFRPGICRLFPLGRYYEENGFKYFLQSGECKNQGRTKIKVKKWIDTPNVQAYEAFVLDWHMFLENLIKQLKEADEVLAKKISMLVLNLFYIKPYDESRDFYEQYYERRKQFCWEDI